MFSTGNKGLPFDTIELYDVDTDEWTTAAPMSLAHCSCAHINHEGRLYVFGGLSPNGPTNCVEKIEFVRQEAEDQTRKPAAGKGGNKKKHR